MSTLRQILNLYATTDSQIKFEANRMKNGKVTVLRLVVEEQEEEEEEEKGGGGGGRNMSMLMQIISLYATRD